MDGRDEDIWREAKLGSTPTTKYFRSPTELAITVRNAHRYRISKSRGRPLPPPAWNRAALDQVVV